MCPALHSLCSAGDVGFWPVARHAGSHRHPCERQHSLGFAGLSRVNRLGRRRGPPGCRRRQPGGGDTKTKPPRCQKSDQLGEAHPAAHPSLGDCPQKTDQDGRGIGRRGFWERKDPFPPTKPNSRSPVERSCDGLSLSPAFLLLRGFLEEVHWVNLAELG